MVNKNLIPIHKSVPVRVRIIWIGSQESLLQIGKAVRIRINLALAGAAGGVNGADFAAGKRPIVQGRLVNGAFEVAIAEGGGVVSDSERFRIGQTP